MSKSLIRDADNQPTAFIAQIEDVTPAKRAERVLRESSERFQAILDNAPMAVHMKDLDGRYILVNKMAAAMADLELDEVIGKSCGVRSERTSSYWWSLARISGRSKVMPLNSRAF